MPLILEKEGEIELNENVLKLIENSTNPNLILFYGMTKRGKSTTLNQLIRGNHETWKFKNKKPFFAHDSIESITKGCDIFGPIKASILIKRHLLNINLEEDFDVFFCDTEGFNSLDGINTKLISGILTIFQLCTISISISSQLCNNEDLKDLYSQIQISRYIKNINNSLPCPLILVYISNILYGNGEGYENDEKEESYENIKILYEESRKKQKNKILKDLNDKKKLNIDSNDIEVIPGGKYQNIKHEKEPDHNDPFVKLYWDSIKDILLKFIDVKKNNGPKQMVAWIKFLFDIFKKVKFSNNDLNLDNFIKNYITKSFEDFSKKQFEIKKVTIKENIKNNFNEYINILIDDKKAIKNLNELFDKSMMDIYKKLIPEKVNDFICLSIEQYRVLIKEEIYNEFEIINKNILSDNNIDNLIKDIVIMIKNAKFKDEINYDEIKIDKLWNDVYEKHKLILDYFMGENIYAMNNLKESFISKIRNKINNLIDKKKNWEEYFKEKTGIIQEKIDIILFDFFKKYNYQEDLQIFQIKYDEYYNKIYNKIFTTLKNEYFNNISEKKLLEINKKTNQIFKKKFDSNILNKKLPIWKDIKSEIYIRIKKLFEEFIFKFFLNKEFLDDINLNLCNKQAFLNLIPIDFMQRNYITNNKQNEIIQLINNEINNNITIISNKINKLPSFDKFIEELLNKCSIKLNIKMKELFDKFDYAEDIIIFDSDIMFSFLTRNLSIYENANSKIEQINKKIRKLCDEKANEYIIKILENKPEWKNIKNDLINYCENYKKSVFKNIFYQEDIKTAIKDDLIKNSKYLINLFSKAKQNKKEEINNILEKTIEEINRKKYSLPKWSVIKNFLFQESIFEIEKLLKFGKYKSINFGINQRDVINYIIMKIKEKKILDKCLDKKRKDELFNNIRERVEIMVNIHFYEEKNKQLEKIKRQNELKNKEKILNITNKKLKIIKEETAKLEKEVNNIMIKYDKLFAENSDRILAEKLEIENLKKKLDKSNWRKFIGKNVQIRSILGHKNLDIIGANINNFSPLILWDAHGQSNQKFTMILHGDNTVSFINNGFAIDVKYGIVENCNQIHIYQRNDTNAQKFFIIDQHDGWFSLHSALNPNYCIDINGGCPDNLTKVQLYEYNGSNAQKFSFIE